MRLVTSKDIVETLYYGNSMCRDILYFIGIRIIIKNVSQRVIQWCKAIKKQPLIAAFSWSHIKFYFFSPLRTE